MDVFVVTSGIILIEEIIDSGYRIHFGNYFISMLRPNEIIRDLYPEGFTIDYFIDSLLVTFIKGHYR